MRIGEPGPSAIGSSNSSVTACASVRPMKRGSTAPGGAAIRSAAAVRAGDVVAAVVGDACRATLPTEEDRRAGREGTGDRLAFVERHLPARRKVVDGERGAIEVGHLLHRLAHHERIAAVVSGQRVGQQHPFVGMRRTVDAGTLEEADAADAEDVGDEAEARAVEGEQYRAARQLPLGLLDAVHAPGGEIDLGLQDAVGPHERHEVGARCAAEPDRDRLQALPGPERSARCRPPSTAIRCGPRAGSRSRGVGAALVAGDLAPGGREGQVARALRPRPPLEQAGSPRPMTDGPRAASRWTIAQAPTWRPM